jgi:hypothetical protein
MRKMVVVLPVLLLALFFGLGHSYGQSALPRFSYAYVAVTYSCKAAKKIVVFSQVFGACYQETNHSEIASSQRDTFARVAAAACAGGLAFEGQRSSYPYQGPAAEDTANKEREKDVHDTIGYGFRAESVHLQTPYSSKCR